MAVGTFLPDIRRAWRERLLTVDCLPEAVAWEGREFTPPADAAYASEALQVAGQIVRALGRGGTIQHTLLGNLSLFYPAGRGTVEAETVAGAIMDALRPGTALVYGTHRAVVMNIEARGLLQDAQWLHLPIQARIVGYTMN